ncbi:response regulator [Aquabacter sp. L1I39]|uniref:response regulator transcription factor n=1 Tax=Aquabacter sp. L1I39 TaxID=2820278 RepID=UPI001ADD3FFB|nr:response regulator [Aquabacter sp. L1I39]QTL02747.1 response regulator [Aquabacter sp. L1I39]
MMTCRTSPVRLLLVEDDPLERRRLEGVLAGLGHEVESVGDGDAALARLLGERFDAVLLDLVIPGLDGMGLIGALRRRGDDTPVVAAVTAAGLEGAASAMKAGANDFVVKPAGALRLKVALDNAMALAAARRAAASNVVTLPVARPAVEEEPADALSLTDRQGHVRALVQIEAEAIRAAVSLYGGRMSEVARRLGIGRSTLYRRMAALGLASEEPLAALAVAAE